MPNVVIYLKKWTFSLFLLQVKSVEEVEDELQILTKYEFEKMERTLKEKEEAEKKS